MEYISHIKKPGTASQPWDIQSNASHSHGVADLAERFASEFGMGSWGRVLGLLHDKGKEKHDFQEYIQDVNGIEGHSRYDRNNKHHAIVGAQNVRSLYGKAYDNLLANQIAGHHAGLYDYMELERNLEVTPFPGDVTPVTEKYPLGKLLAPKGVEDVHHLSRRLYSCLVDADYLDTEAFMNPESAALRGGKPTLGALLPLLENHLETLKADAADSEVNRVRDMVQQRCRVMADSDKGFYSLTVPTGGGKTLSSLLWAMKHAVRNGQKRIIIAIPYTSIIVQTAGILKRIFGEENVLEHHSNVNPEQVRDERQKEQLRLATENWDYPIIVTTNVQLFESMFSNRPSDCRKLHNICNSVLILDEVQTLPTDFLQPIVDSLKTYQQFFGVSVLFTTASQPILSGLIEGCNPRAGFPGIEGITEIIPADYRLHDRLRRVELAIDDQGRTYDEVATEVAKHDRVLCIVNTRRDAKELYERLPKEGLTLHLSRMMCPEHVSQTIEKIKSALNDDQCRIIRVVATQLIEAGVDIDFPVVFRQEAGLDSVLQAAGRCNREGKAGMGTTYVFSLSAEHPLPSGSISDTNNARRNIVGVEDWFSPEAMTEYFKQLYCRKDSFDKEGMRDYLYNLKELCFETAAKAFHLIEDKGVTVHINHGDCADLIAGLRQQGTSYGLMRKLSQYSVNIHRHDFCKLIEAGQVEEITEGVYFIPDRAQYDEQTGLRTDNHWLEEICII